MRDFEEVSIANLVAFINRQPGSRSVDHSSFDTCAIGDFTRSHLGGGRYASDIVAKSLFRQTGTGDLRLFVYLLISGTLVRYCPFTTTLMDELIETDRASNRATYGQMRMGLAEKFPELGFKQIPPPQMNGAEWATGKVKALIGEPA